MLDHISNVRLHPKAAYIGDHMAFAYGTSMDSSEVGSVGTVSLTDLDNSISVGFVLDMLKCTRISQYMALVKFQSSTFPVSFSL